MPAEPCLAGGWPPTAAGVFSMPETGRGTLHPNWWHAKNRASDTRQVTFQFTTGATSFTPLGSLGCGAIHMRLRNHLVKWIYGRVRLRIGLIRVLVAQFQELFAVRRRMLGGAPQSEHGHEQRSQLLSCLVESFILGCTWTTCWLLSKGWRRRRHKQLTQLYTFRGGLE